MLLLTCGFGQTTPGERYAVHKEGMFFFSPGPEDRWPAVGSLEEAPEAGGHMRDSRWAEPLDMLWALCSLWSQHRVARMVLAVLLSHR